MTVRIEAEVYVKASDRYEAERKVIPLIREALTKAEESGEIEYYSKLGAATEGFDSYEPVMEADADAGAGNLLRFLEQENIFTEKITSFASPRSIDINKGKGIQIPVTIQYMGREASGELVWVPADVRVKGDPGDPEHGVGPSKGQEFHVPEGHNIYAWNIRDVFEPHEIDKMTAAAKKLLGAVKKDFESHLSANILDKFASQKTEIDNETGEGYAVTHGIMTSPVKPEDIKMAMTERIPGMRGILPPSVAENRLQNVSDLISKL
jgi:hypothetical protein